MISLRTFRGATVRLQPDVRMKTEDKETHIVKEPFPEELQIQEMFTPNCRPDMNEPPNRSGCQTQGPAKSLPTSSWRRKLKRRSHRPSGTHSAAVFDRATCVNRHGVAKSSSCWPSDGQNSDIIITRQADFCTFFPPSSVTCGVHMPRY